MSSKFLVSTPQPSDAARLTTIDESAYLNNPMRNSISTYSTSTPEQQAEHVEWATDVLEQYLATDQSSHCFTALDKASGTIAGWIELKKPGFTGPRPTGRLQDEMQPEKNVTKPQKQSPCLRMDKVSDFVQMWELARSKIMGTRNDYWCIARLLVAPEFQRQGAGQLLLHKALQLAEPGGLDVYIAATPASQRLLEKNGFRVMDFARTASIQSQLVIMLREGKK